MTTLALGYLAASFMVQLLRTGETAVATDIGLRASNRLRADLTRHCLSLDLSFHAGQTPGQLIERIDGDVTQLNHYFSRLVVELAGGALLLVGVVTMLLAADLTIGAALGLFAGLTLALLWRVHRLPRRYWRETRAKGARYFGYIEERLTGTEDIRALGAVPQILHNLRGHARPLFRAHLKARTVGRSVFGLTNTCFACGLALALILAARSYLAGTTTLGGVYLVFSYANMLRQPIQTIVREVSALEQAAASLERIRELLETRATIDYGQQNLPRGPLSVELTDLSFTYPETSSTGDRTVGNRVLHGLSLHLRPGQRLGLVGRTGSGKSTIARLLTRLYHPDGGQIRFSGLAAEDIKLSELRRGIGFVSQEVQLFDASVRDNLTFFDDQLADHRLTEALTELGLAPWLARLPEGLDTHLKNGAAGLSAGEAQLLALARVFLRNPGLVILDEASSSVDPSTHARLETAIDRLLAGRTAIMIAHRPEALSHCDDIAVLEAGRLVEYGPRTQLSADPNSRYAGILAASREVPQA